MTAVIAFAGMTLLFFTTQTMAEWVKVGTSQTAVHYVDPATVRSDGNLRLVWSLQDLVDERPDGTHSIRVLQEYDCAENRFRYLQVASYSGPMARGKVLLEYGLRDRWSPRTIGKYYYAVGKIVCSR
jgi:hypothetical protein